MTGYDKFAYLGYLRLVPMFSACTDDELQQVVDRAQVRQVPDGTPLVVEGDMGTEFFVIAAGKADVQRGNKEVAALGKGDFFGELALFDPAPRNATVVASGPVTAVVIGQDNFESLLGASPGIRDSLLRGMAHRIHELDARV
jgi:CRP-like cAMP-binding protein